MKHFLNLKISKFIFVVLTILISGCNRGGSSGDFSLLESGGKGTDPACKIISTKPENKTFKVGATSGKLNQFIVQSNAESCKAEFLINDVIVTTTGLIAEIDSDKFMPGQNKIKVNVKNDAGSDSFEWTVTKNNPPACNGQSPTNLSPAVAAGSNLTLTVQGQDADNDTLQFSWKYNGAKNDTLLVPIISSTTASQVDFRPQAENGGTQSIKAEISDGYDTVSCSWSPRVTGDCSIASKTPDVPANNVRILSTGTSPNSFSISTVTAGCPVNWTLNGVPLSGTETSKILNSSSFSVGNNVLVASVSGAVGQSSQTWSVVKNSPPACGSMTPSNLSTQTVGISQNLNLSITASDINSDALTFSWQLNNQSVSSSILTTSSAGGTANATFVPTSAQVGANSVQVQVNDGFESTTCSWPVQVLPACDISSSSPDHLTNRRFAASGSQVVAFNVTPNYPGYCTVAWDIDGTSVGTGSLYNLASNNSLLSSGSNHTIRATVTNGSGSTVTRTWNLVKNSPPACGTLSPATTTMSMAQGGNQVFQSTVTDGDGDSFNFTWKVNGSSSSALLSLGNTASSSSAQFSPTISNVGNNIVSLNIDDGYDTVSCSWNVAVTGDCSVTGNSPSTGSQIKIKANDIIGNLYSITTSTAGCPVNWTINGLAVSGTQSFKTFTSSDFSPGNNILQAVVSNGASSTTTTWNIKRNSLPSAVQTPTSAGIHNLSINTAYNFTTNVTDVDGDTLTTSWKINGTPIASLSPPITYSVISASNPFQEQFTFNNSYTGSRTITATISDGTDTVDFNWDAMVYNNCSVASSFPSSTQRTSVQNNVTTTYGVIPNDASCTIAWKLNGSSVGTGNLYDLQSLNGALSATNTLVATLDNGVGTPATQTWTIVKNAPPTCLAGQSPAATGNDLFYTNTMNFSCSATDSENDPVTFSWKLNNAYPELFSAINSSGYNSSSTLSPTVGVLGSGQSVTANFFDGWDTGFCQWNVNIKDPSAVQIQACSPVQGATTLLSQYSSTPTYDIKSFTVSATGPDITYRWKENGTIIPGQTAAQLKVSTNATSTYTGQTPDYIWAVGTRDLVVEVVDKYNNVQSCTWNLKRNRPPQINTAAAGTGGTGIQMWIDGTSFTAATSTIKMNYASALQVKIYGTDLDTGDAAALQYSWKVNSQVLPSGGDSLVTYSTASDKTYSVATVTPNYDSARLGNLTLTAVISDGIESVEQTWNININMFSNDCNTLYNASVGSRGGQVCTLVGQAGVGADRLPADDMTKMRFQPWDFTMDGNNIIFTDYNSNSVFYYNTGTTAGDDVTKFGKSIPHGKIIAISGAGAAGITPNMLLSTDPFKMNSPRQVAYYNGRAYVADINNNRVVVIKEDGVSESFVGRVSDNSVPSNVTAANSTAGAAGTSQYCLDASGLKVVNESGTIYLYIACRFSIKKADITNPLSGNYGKTYLVVGKPGPSGDLTDGWENGDPLLEARVSRPRAIDTDANGNIYWTEHEGHLRVYNRGATSLSFFNGKSISSATTFTVTDYVNSGGAITGLSTASKLQAIDATANTATKVVVLGPTNGANSYAGNGHCVPLRVQLQNASNAASVYGSIVSVTMSAAPASVSFYNDLATCAANGATNTNFNIAAGQREVEVWAKSTTNSTYTITATSGTVTSGSLANYSVVAGTTTTQKILVANAPASFHFQDCTRVWITPANASNAPASPTAGTKIRLYAQNGGSFYASTDSTCSGTPISSITYSGGATSYAEGFVYYSRSTVIPAGKVGTLFGNPATIGGNSAAYAAGYAGTAQIRNGYGLAVNYSGNNILGFFISSWDYHNASYINNNDTSSGTSLTQSYGGATWGSNNTSTGMYHEFKVFAGANGTAGFNGDTKLGVNSRFNNIAGISFDSTRDNLMFGDVSNWRARIMRITSGTNQNILATTLGSGRARYGWYGDAEVPAMEAVFEQPTDLIFDSASNMLLVSDMRNGRIRKVDLARGGFSTYLGKGRGDMTVPSEDQFAMMLGGPQQLSIMKKSTPTPIDFLLFADSTVSGNNQGTAANITCAIRAFNRDTSLTKNIFGEDVQSGKINNIVGDYSLGCSSTITLGQNGLSTALNNPVGLVNDGTNMYVSDFSNHCIVKVDSSNVVSNFIGRCGTAGSSDGVGNGDNTTNPTLVTYPMQMVMDPQNSTNFFFVEGHNQSVGKIRYANTTSSLVNFAVGNAIGKGAGQVGTTTLWTFAPASTTARINGITAFSNKWVCISSGGYISNSHWLDANTGGHGVYCFDRGDNLGNIVRVVGSNPSNTNRGGSSLGLEHELKAGTSVQLYQPHGIAFDTDGNLYISERGAHVIRMVRRWWP